MSELVSWIRSKAKQVNPLVVAPIIIFSGLCFVWVYKNRVCKRKPCMFMRSVSMGVLHGGKLTLQRLLDSHGAQADMSSLDEAEHELEYHLAREPPNFPQLQRIIGKLEMSGKEDQAVKKLQEAYAKAAKEERHHEAYEIQMLIVELLIYQGHYKEALSCSCLNDEDISDARRPLYKGIIYILLGDKSDRTRRSWEEFQEIRNEFSWSYRFEDERLYEVTKDFNKFLKIVNQLERDIHDAQGKKSPKK